PSDLGLRRRLRWGILHVLRKGRRQQTCLFPYMDVHGLKDKKSAPTRLTCLFPYVFGFYLCRRPIEVFHSFVSKVRIILAYRGLFLKSKFISGICLIICENFKLRIFFYNFHKSNINLRNIMLRAYENEQLTLVRESARQFSNDFIKPHVMSWDEEQYFPIELFKKLGEYGFMGILVPEVYGGAGLDYQAYITILDEISQVCGSIGLSVAAHNSLCTNHILSFANEEQKQRYLPKLSTAEWIGAWGLTETGSGSDAGGLATTAVREGDYYILNGSKTFITHAISGDVAVVMA